jgi:hypothetical protein
MLLSTLPTSLSAERTEELGIDQAPDVALREYIVAEQEGTEMGIDRLPDLVGDSRPSMLEPDLDTLSRPGLTWVIPVLAVPGTL